MAKPRATTDRLAEYRQRRNADRTPEPFTRGGPEAAGSRFVVQRHSARNLHYDLRLERDDVLLSWAVPKGLPVHAGSRRRAIRTEDHPPSYLTFEGEIPEGEYGAGTIDVYDSGGYELVEEKRDGALTVRLEGERLRGLWTMVPTRLDGDARNWLVVRHSDDPEARPPARRRYLPMVATPADEPPTRGDWIYEVKWDGYRAIARLDEGEATLWSRRGQDLTERFSAVASELGRGLRTFDCVVDGEVCALDEHGRPSFQLVQQGRGRLVYFVFDLLELDGTSLVGRPLRERRALLEELVDPRTAPVRLSDVFDDGRALLDVVRAQGLEGLVAKRATSRYRPGERSGEWLKVKARRADDFPIVGYVRGEGARTRLGSLVLARREGGRLRYAGNVGTGFTEAEIARLLELFRPLVRERPPLAPVPRDPRLRPRSVVWVEPRLVAEVEFTEWTHDGILRAPVYKGLREDSEREQELELRRGDRTVRLTHLDRVWWPDEGTRKRDVVEYYRAIAPVLLPHIRNRPFTFKRHFTGPRSPFAWVKDAPPEIPDWIRTASLPAKSRGGELVRYALLDDELALLWAVQYGVVDLHVWTARSDRPDRPDYVLFDLDPAHVPFGDVVRAALLLRDALAALGLDSLAKTTGGDGMHVQVPIERRQTYEEVREFCEIVADALARSSGGLVTTERSIARRHGVFVDVKMNGHGQQVVAVYSVRPRAGAPVAAPLRWEEVTEQLDPREFTMERVRERAERDGDLFEPLLSKRQRLATALARLG